MSFYVDKQTQEDLNLLGRYKNNSIVRLFDETVTTGGRKLLEKMFQEPLTDPDSINKRTSIFSYFSTQPISFPFSTEEFEVVENYLASNGSENIFDAGLGIAYKKVLYVLANDKDYEQLNLEICNTIGLLIRFSDFIAQFSANTNNPYSENLELIRRIYSHPKLQWLKSQDGVKDIPLFKLIRYDYLLRTILHKEMQVLSSIVFDLDVCIAISQVAVKRGFSYANALAGNANKLSITGLYHPCIAQAIGNDLSLIENSNVLFLTGANMAGKSTLMKSFGISMYLAHMGFPVAAHRMEFSVKDGLYTSINVPDNLEMGYSHFYAEVLRVKKVAEEVAESKDLIVIFDELFKGTNVKDAYDATLSITEAFSEHSNCFFMISTHIIEVAHELSKRCDNFQFIYLPTVMDGVVPRYTYKLTQGITEDRQGMIIIENEGIIDIIKNTHHSSSVTSTI
ncbi:MutS domain III [Pedobacter steynii]|uniref:MutS domain III n=1 Tax=Pedobacter steynii TaxID=430522 RepID=A0A1G9P682_9SPHI|nr:hypothetical protein [Pedobacter steynii]NQX39082.1 DNA mismatch repair protein [Pedobacter steynii]SDL94239.1 MutS domain III [Pedobacter steynii]